MSHFLPWTLIAIWQYFILHNRFISFGPRLYLLHSITEALRHLFICRSWQISMRVPLIFIQLLDLMINFIFIRYFREEGVELFHRGFKLVSCDVESLTYFLFLRLWPLDGFEFLGHGDCKLFCRFHGDEGLLVNEWSGFEIFLRQQIFGYWTLEWCRKLSLINARLLKLTFVHFNNSTIVNGLSPLIKLLPGGRSRIINLLSADRLGQGGVLLAAKRSIVHGYSTLRSNSRHLCRLCNWLQTQAKLIGPLRILLPLWLHQPLDALYLLLSLVLLLGYQLVNAMCVVESVVVY